MSEVYVCPQCNGELILKSGELTCADCGLDMGKVLKSMKNRKGPLSDVCDQLIERLEINKNLQKRKSNKFNGDGIQWQ